MDANGLIDAIKKAKSEGIKIAYTNECFEYWILFHFIPNPSFPRGKSIENMIQQAFKREKLGDYKKNQKVFELLKLMFMFLN